MNDIKEFLSSHDLFAKYIGVELLEVSAGKAKARLEIAEHHLNSVRTVQGGVIFTLADFTFAAAVNSYDNVAVAINVNIAYVKAAAGGTLYAEAEEVSLSPKIGLYTVRVTDSDGDIVANFQGMAYRKKELLLSY
jgi:acyl-CoA thioesterase